MIILINRNMTCERVRPTTNRSGTLLMKQSVLSDHTKSVFCTLKF